VPRLEVPVRGPDVASEEHIPAMNAMFSDSFTDRYRRDGLVGVRVPQLNPKVWRYAIDDADGGAMVWWDEDGQLAAFNMVHRSGGEGWMGPLAVRPNQQGSGLGRRIVEAGIDWLKAHNVSTIGLETMPRTVDNIGFYSRLTFVPRYLTVTMVRDVQADHATNAASRLSVMASLDQGLEACRVLTSGLLPGWDFTRELTLTAGLGLGDTMMVYRGEDLKGFGLWHSVPLAEGRPSEELRVLKVVAQDDRSFRELVAGMDAVAAEVGLKRVSIRCQTGFPDAYRYLVESGFQVQWTDLRMTLAGYDEPIPAPGVVLSNWEI